MPITDFEAQELIILKVGDVDPITGNPLAGGLSRSAGVVGARIDLLWATHADKTLICPRLRELYVERDSLDLLLGTLGALVDHTFAGETLHLSQRVDRLTKRRYNIQLEINRMIVSSRSQRAPAVGPLVTQAPISPPTTAPVLVVPDANDPAYAGSPYLSRRGVL